MAMRSVLFCSPHVPFAGEVGLVSVGFKESGEVERAVRKNGFVAGGESGIAEAPWVTTGEGGDAGGCALRHRVVTSAERALCREGIKMGRVDFGVVVADVAPALVIGDDGDDIRLLCKSRKVEDTR